MMKKVLCRAPSLLIFLCLILSFLFTITDPVMVYAASESISVTGQYTDKSIGRTLSYTTEYDDAFFLKKKSTSLQGRLAKLSMLASAAVYNEKYAEDLMKKCGFTDNYKRISNAVSKSDNDHVSASIGTKKAGKTTIVAIWIRGTNANYEWVSNFNIGKGNSHSGFSKAEKELWSQVKKYLDKNNISGGGPIKFWITGHSRGGAVADLMAKRLNKLYKQKNVYAYTFAAPRVSKKASPKTEKAYRNIFNFLNPGDIFTDMTPEKWGYYRYGKDIVLSAAAKAEMKKIFKKSTGETYAGINTSGKKKILKAFKDYAGNDLSSYYSVKRRKIEGTNKITRDPAPVTFMQKGLGYILAGDGSGYIYALAIAIKDPEAEALLDQFIGNTESLKAITHAHTTAAYLSWLEAMY